MVMPSTTDLHVVETVLAFASVVALCLVLKRRGIIHEADSPLFARLLTQVALPAVIFYQLSLQPVSRRQVLMILVMVVTGLVAAVAAGFAGKLLRLDRPKIGALMLTSSFGSSALLGYPLIAFAFPGNPEAMADAILVSELGVGLPIFTLGPLIAMYFGETSGPAGQRGRIIAGYFRSPVFIAVVLGLLVAPLRLPTDNLFLAPAYEALRMVDGALTVLACLVLALQLKLTSMKGIWPMFIVSAVIQLALQPWVASLQADAFHLTPEQKQVLTLICAMPSAVLGPVFATRYKCASDTASALVLMNILASVLVVPIVFGMLN